MNKSRFSLGKISEFVQNVRSDIRKDIPKPRDVWLYA
jgi:hypothetical protein